MNQHYFLKSGEYNHREFLPDNATSWMIIPTDHWTLEMWRIIWDIADDRRYEMAEHFSINVHNVSKGKCSKCGLYPDQLEGQHLVGLDLPGMTYDDWQTNVSQLVKDGVI